MIRRAEARDLPQLVEIASAFHTATQYAKFGCGFSAAKMQANLETWIDSEDALPLVAEVDGRIVGAAGAVLSSMYMSDDLIAVELYWWVYPAARGTGAASQLLADLKTWAVDCECKALVMSSIATITDSPADAIYARMGLEVAEKSWIARL